MKKYLILASAALVALAACNKEFVETPVLPNETVSALTFTSARPQLDADTRTAWDSETSSVVWQSTDKIKVGFTFNDAWWAQTAAYSSENITPNNHVKFYLSDEVTIDDNSGNVGTFVVPTGNSKFTGPTTSGNFVFYAVYPGALVDNNLDTAPSATVTLKTSQSPAANSFDATTDIMVATSDVVESTGLPTDPIELNWNRVVAHANLTFSNMAFDGTEVPSKITLTFNEEAKVAGNFSVNIADGTIGTGSANEIVLEGSGLAASGNSIITWATVLPVSFTSLNVEIKTDKATYVRSITGLNKTFQKNARNRLTINMATANRTAVAAAEWVKKDISAITSNDVFVIVGNNGSDYAMSNGNGTGSAPTAVAVTIVDNKLSIAPAENIQWTISGNATDGYTFYPYGTTGTWLYCTNTNDGVRVGTNSNKTFTISSGYLLNSATTRYVGIYNSQDWRCYTSINNNIKDQTFAYYVKSEPDTRAEAGLSWSSATASASIEDGDEITFTAPTLSNPNSVSPVTYESTDPDVAEVSEAGAVTVKAEGETTIKAIFAGNTSYKPQTVEYTLTVTDNRTPAAATIADVISGGDGEYTVPNVVVYAVKGNALILGDETGKMYAYKKDHGLSAGAVRTVSGSTTTMDSGVYEFDSPDFTGTGTTTVNHGTAVEFDSQASSLKTTLASRASAVYIHAKGTQSSRNITTTGGNVLYLSAVEDATNGKTVEVYGYIYYYNSNYSNFNFMVTSIEVDTTTPSLSVSPTTLNWAAAETDSRTVTVTLNASAAAGDYTLTPIDGDTNDWTITNNNGTFSVAPKAANSNTQSAKSITIRVSHTADSGVYEDVVCTQAKAGSASYVDELNQTLTGITGTTYSEWSNKSASNTGHSSAVYAGQSAGGNSSIQLRSNNDNSGVVSTTSGGKVKKIVVSWNSNTSSGRTLNVYGKNSAYTDATDLYDSSKQGTMLGTIVYGTSTEIIITGDYEYIGFRSASGAMYLSEVKITWEN